MDNDELISRLFDKWGLTQEQRSSLTLTWESNRQDYTELLLSIHAHLRILYPRNEELLYGWVCMREYAFDNMPPIEIMISEGEAGIKTVLQFLKNQTQR